MRRVSLFMLLVCSCSSTETGDSRAATQVVSLAYDALEAQQAKHQRHETRELLRSLGKRVCEEGEWPQRWPEDGCRECGCDQGEVRWCTMEYCHNRGSGRRKR